MTNRSRGECGVVFPSPVTILSVVAVAVAAIAFVATRHGTPADREITTVSRHQTPHHPSHSATPPPTKPARPAIDRSKIYVEVYNNSGVTGLASRVAAQASTVGWQVVGADNWYGTIPSSTVYFPSKLRRAAHQLALDLGVRRTAAAVDPMKMDRLTVILTGSLD